MSLKLFLRIGAFLLLAGLLLVTLGPVDWRPRIGLSPNRERFLAFVIFGFIFAMAFPRRFLTATLVVFGTAVAFELGQVFLPNRHGEARDLAFKLAGGAAGLLAGLVAATLLAYVRRKLARRPS
jgi:glycopeptide antibiotics resistance protein